MLCRDPLMEYKILTRINCHKQKYDKLFKTVQGEFKNLNKYADILPFKNNRVLLGKPQEVILFNVNTKAAALSNVSQSQNSDDDEREMNASFEAPIVPKQVLKKQNSHTDMSYLTYQRGTVLSNENLNDYINASYINTCLD